MKWTILTLISIFIAYCCSQMLVWDQSGNLIAHSYSIWGDWSAHFTFISNFLNRGIGWVSGDNPIFHGMPFQYPFLSHWITAVFASLTQMNVPHATFYLSMLLLLSLPFVLYRFFNIIGLSTRQSILAIILFLFLGGFQAFDSNLYATEPLTNQFNSGSVFTQIVLFELFPQRAFLFGMIMLILGLTHAIKKVLSNTFTKKHFFFYSLYFSLLSWMHLHSWITMGALLLIYLLFNLKQKNTSRIFQFGTLTLLLSLPLIYFLLLRSNSNTAHAVSTMNWEKWFPGWAQNPKANLTGAQDMNPLFFWIYNTGIFIPLVLIGIKLRSSNKLITVLGTTASFLFLVAITFNIQPYFYDNLKIFTYAFLLLSPLAAIGIDALFNRKILIPLGVLLLSIQSYTAINDYLFFKNQKVTAPFYTIEDFELADQFRNLRRSANSLVLIAPKHNHWVSTLAGNPVLMGYPGWLWSWGISYPSREQEVNEALSGSVNALDILKKYSIEYIVVNDRDMAGKTPVSISFLRAHFPILLEKDSWHIFTTLPTF